MSIYACVCTYFIYICIYTHVHARVWYIYTHVCIHTCVPANTQTKHKQKNRHTHKQTHIHTPIVARELKHATSLVCLAALIYPGSQARCCGSSSRRCVHVYVNGSFPRSLACAAPHIVTENLWKRILRENNHYWSSNVWLNRFQLRYLDSIRFHDIGSTVTSDLCPFCGAHNQWEFGLNKDTHTRTPCHAVRLTHTKVRESRRFQRIQKFSRIVLSSLCVALFKMLDNMPPLHEQVPRRDNRTMHGWK